MVEKFGFIFQVDLVTLLTNVIVALIYTCKIDRQYFNYLPNSNQIFLQLKF